MDSYDLKSHNPNEEIYGQSLLYWSVHQNNLSMTKHLVQNGADVNKADRLGRTPLHIACFFGFHDLAIYLLNNGAIVDKGCFTNAHHSWDGSRQKDIINLLNKYPKSH